jgi:hypothetical protein
MLHIPGIVFLGVMVFQSGNVGEGRLLVKLAVTFIAVHSNRSAGTAAFATSPVQL